MKGEIWQEQQYQILKAKDTRALKTSLLIYIPELGVVVLTKRHVGSGNETEEEKASLVLLYLRRLLTAVK